MMWIFLHIYSTDLQQGVTDFESELIVYNTKKGMLKWNMFAYILVFQYRQVPVADSPLALAFERDKNIDYQGRVYQLIYLR